MKLKQYVKGCQTILLLTAIYACNEPDDPAKYVGTVFDTSTVDTTKYHAEYIQYSTAKINGVLPLDSKYADFIKVIGKPDSVINFNWNTDCQFYEEPYKYIYFQESMFFLVNDTAIFQNIDFRKRPDLEINTPAITLNSKTTLQDIKKFFPNAVSKIRTIDGPDRHLRLVDIGASKIFEDAWWILLFEGDKLVIVEMYSPC